MSEILKTEELLKWIGDSDAQEQLLIKEAPISNSTLNQIKRGYQPHERTVKAILDVMIRFPKNKATKRTA